MRTISVELVCIFTFLVYHVEVNFLGLIVEEVITSNWTDSDGNHDGGVSTGIGFTISWQRGSLNEAGRNGAFLIEVLESCLSQIEYFQSAKFQCQENADAIYHLEESISYLQSRLNRRKNSGTLGTTQGN